MENGVVISFLPSLRPFKYMQASSLQSLRLSLPHLPTLAFQDRDHNRMRPPSFARTHCVSQGDVRHLRGAPRHLLGRQLAESLQPLCHDSKSLGRNASC
eukprot:766584-Hanusia_phi.AAC.2